MFPNDYIVSVYVDVQSRVSLIQWDGFIQMCYFRHATLENNCKAKKELVGNDTYVFVINSDENKGSKSFSDSSVLCL